jgi:hypothetical protein
LKGLTNECKNILQILFFSKLDMRFRRLKQTFKPRFEMQTKIHGNWIIRWITEQGQVGKSQFK